MDVDEIHMVCPEPFQASLQAPQKLVAGTIGDLRCQPDFLATRRHYLADASFAFAISVGICCVQISDAQIDCVIEDRHRAPFVLVHEEAAAAAESKNRNLGAGSP